MTSQVQPQLYLTGLFRQLMADYQILSLDDMYAYYARHSADLFGYLIYLGFDEETATDLVHDSFYKACRQVARGAVRAENVKAWLLRIAHNTAMSRHRRKSEIAHAQIEIAGEDTSAQSDDKILADSIVQFVASHFSEREQQVFHLRIIQALSYQDVADILKMSKTTVMRVDAANLSRIKDHFGDTW